MAPRTATWGWATYRGDTGHPGRSCRDIKDATWSTGATGIGLGRLRCLRLADAVGMDDGSRAALRSDVASSLRITLTHGFGANHSLAYGDFGSLDFLAQAAATLDDPHITTALADRVAQTLNNIQQVGWVTAAPGGLETPGLMAGLAGVGYGLLRLCMPERVPCVLSLQAPRAR